MKLLFSYPFRGRHAVVECLVVQMFALGSDTTLRGAYKQENQVLNFSTLLARSKHDYFVAEGGHKIQQIF